jgi:hypothetical protein
MRPFPGRAGASASSPARAESTRLLAAVVWRGERPAADPDALHAAFRLATANQVDGQFARAYPDRLGEDLRRVDASVQAFRHNLLTAARSISDAGVVPILIEADAETGSTYGNFDLVVGREGRLPAVGALTGWTVHTASYPLEPDKILLHPATGPAAHIHETVSWFGVRVITYETLLGRAESGEHPWRSPAPVDALRIVMAHACFQNLAFDLGELLGIRSLLGKTTIEDASEEARAEGWGSGFDLAARAAWSGMRSLDEGTPVPLPFPLPAIASIGVGLRHAGHLMRVGRLSDGLRESALRIPLAAAKVRRRAKVARG